MNANGNTLKNDINKLLKQHQKNSDANQNQLQNQNKKSNLDERSLDNGNKQGGVIGGKGDNKLKSSDLEIQTYAEKAKKLTDVHKDGDRWIVKNKDGLTVKEFEIGKHKELTKNGTNNFFQSHHGIQDKWAEVKFKEFSSKYDLKESLFSK